MIDLLSNETAIIVAPTVVVGLIAVGMAWPDIDAAMRVDEAMIELDRVLPPEIAEWTSSGAWAAWRGRYRAEGRTERQARKALRRMLRAIAKERAKG